MSNIIKSAQLEVYMIIRAKTAYLCLWVIYHHSTPTFMLMTPSLFVNSPTYSAPFDLFSVNWNKLNPIHYLKQRICHKPKDGTAPKSTSFFTWPVSPRWTGRTLTAVEVCDPAARTACVYRKARGFLINESDLSASVFRIFFTLFPVSIIRQGLAECAVVIKFLSSLFW